MGVTLTDTPDPDAVAVDAALAAHLSAQRAAANAADRRIFDAAVAELDRRDAARGGGTSA